MKMKILAVDDSVVNLATIEQELKDRYEVMLMTSGRRAIKFLYQEKVDLILLDIEMPGLDGIETLKEIRKQDNGVTVPVIFLTAKQDKRTVIEGTRLGIMDYIIKPFNRDDLRQRIESALKRRGALPMEEEELFHRVKEINEYIQAGNAKSASIKVEEVLGYQLEETVIARLQAVKTKLDAGDLEVAARMVDRILQMYAQKNFEEEELLPISLGELNSKLLYILDDISKFQVDRAIERFDDLFQYAIPAKVKDKCVKAHICLKEYDDGEAERLVQEMIKEL